MPKSAELGGIDDLYQNPFDPTRYTIVAPFVVTGKNKKDPKTLPNHGFVFGS